MKLRNKILTVLTGLALVLGLTVAVAPAANAATGSVLCNTGSTTIFATKSGSNNIYALGAGNCAGNYITNIYIPANQCYVIRQGPTAPNVSYCAGSGGRYIGFWAPNAVWFAYRSR